MSNVKTVKNLLNANEKQAVKNVFDLTTADNFKFTNVQKATASFLDLIQDIADRIDISEFLDEDQDIVSRDIIEDTRKQQLKQQLVDDNDYSSTTLQDLAFIDKNSHDKYFYVDETERVNLVTDDDISSELTDLLNFDIND